MDAEKGEPFAVPSQAALDEMHRHLEEEHGMEFEAERDVSYAGNPRREAALTHRPETPRSAEAFWCVNCPGKVFMVALQPELSAERIDHLALHDPELRSVLAESTEEDRAEAVEAYEAEKSAAALLARYRRRARLRTTKPQPAAQERRAGAQRYLLAKYEEIGDVEETVWELLQLSRRDPKAYRQVMGTDRQFAFETLRKYWQAIPNEERAAAKQRYLERAHSK